ncbi:MAG: hypothetical protein P1U87_03295 [Verrucomicrobiales bacterium]|nr:hypothetical protein [Verrucomicrobiales bacterium]
MAHDTFQVGDLTAVIGDNAADEALSHRAGYNGLWSLHHKEGDRSFFVPGIAGLNFEHIISGEGEADKDVFFEPRRSPMSFRRLSESSAELHQPPTNTFYLESWTTFSLVAPHYIDMTFRFRATQHVFDRGYIALFWASYMNAPTDKSLYFRGGREGNAGPEMWQQLCTPSHNRDSTVRHTKDEFEMTFAEGAPDALYKNFSPQRFAHPYYYGNFDDITMAYLFDRSEGIRFTHSPSGGGVNRVLETTNPAWDFSFLVPNYEVAKEYQFRMRAVFRPRCSRADVDMEFASWRTSID